MELKGRSIIGWGSGESGGRVFTAINPANAQSLQPSYVCASLEEVDRAVRLAAQAFESYRLLSGKEKATFLREIATGMEGIADALAVRTSQESGLPEARIRTETGRTVFQLRLFAQLIELKLA